MYKSFNEYQINHTNTRLRAYAKQIIQGWVGYYVGFTTTMGHWHTPLWYFLSVVIRVSRFLKTGFNLEKIVKFENRFFGRKYRPSLQGKITLVGKNVVFKNLIKAIFKSQAKFHWKMLWKWQLLNIWTIQKSDFRHSNP